MKVWPWPKGPDPIHRDVFVPDLVAELRLVLGLPPDEPAPGEHAASRGMPLPTVADALDLGAWLAWALAGLPLFTKRPLPTLGEAVAVARRVLLGLAMERGGGNITHSAALLKTSRRVVREHLRRVGLYRLAAAVGPEQHGH